MRPNVVKRLLLFWLLLFGAVAAVALLLLPAAAAADPVLVVPDAHDFGEVEVGSTAGTDITLRNTGGLPLIISAIEFRAGSSADFTLLTLPAPPYFVPPLNGGPHYWLDLEIAYTPSAEGDATAVLEVASNDPATPVESVNLSGTGVAATPSPVDDLLAEFDEWVTEGALAGSGSGNSADGRLGALRNMIVVAGDYLDQGEVALAVAQLEAVLERCDGDSPPPTSSRVTQPWICTTWSRS